jgi:hypothetical protein
MLTPRGVKLLYPIPLAIKFPFTFKTGGFLDASLYIAPILKAVDKDASKKPPVLKVKGNLIAKGIG